MSFILHPHEDGRLEFVIDKLSKGVWSHASPLSAPPGFAPVMTNWDVPGGIPTTMVGDEVFLNAAYTAGATINLLTDRRLTTGNTYLLGEQDATDGRIYYWTGTAWALLRKGLTASGTAVVYWTSLQYGSDVLMTNPYDGVYRYDGNTLAPLGSKPIAQMEADEAGVWTGETADTTNFREGLQALYAENTSPAAAASMVYTPATNFDAVTGRYEGIDYASDKSPGTDYYHFKVMFSNTGTPDTTNTRLLVTVGDGDTLNFPMSAWDSDRSGSTFPASPSVGTWYDVYCKGADGTEGGTFNAANIDTFTFSVDSSADTLRMTIDDFYVIYATTFPAVRYIAEFKNILFGAATTSAEDTLYYTPTQAPDEYDATATFPLKTRGERITGIRNFFTQLVITTDNTTHSLSGSVQGTSYPSYVFDQQLVSLEHGCSSHRSIVEANNRLYWWYNGMIIEYRGTGSTKISYPMDVTLATNDPANLQYIVGAAFRAKNQVWWTWRRSTTSANDRVLRYDYIEGALLHTEGLATPLLHQTWVSGTERLLSIDTTARKVYRQGSTNLSFGGTAIAATLELPVLAVPAQSHTFTTAYFQYLSNTGSLVVSYRIADHLRALSAESYSTLETINQATAGEYGLVRIGDEGSLLQLRLTTSGVAAQIQTPILVYARPHAPERIFV